MEAPKPCLITRPGLRDRSESHPGPAPDRLSGAVRAFDREGGTVRIAAVWSRSRVRQVSESGCGLSGRWLKKICRATTLLQMRSSLDGTRGPLQAAAQMTRTASRRRMRGSSVFDGHLADSVRAFGMPGP